MMQHQTPHIIERINTYYGYDAIARIKILQAPAPNPKAPLPRNRTLAPDDERALAAIVGTVEDPSLRHALERLGRGVLRRQKEDATKQ